MARVPRLHVSNRQLESVRQKGAYNRQRVSDKPEGFWWGVGPAWLEWCEGSEFAIGGNVHVLKVNEDRILQINDYEDFDRFHDEFKGELCGGISDGWIDWKAVSELWDGIEITPYLYKRRLDLKSKWYYGWDCACGITWRPRRVIEDVSFIGKWEGGDIKKIKAAARCK